ncbi:MAG TPA: glycoside hydrolase family 13 protein [Clostridia bacterium]|nr:glycoside hydrolase family 13 protein [Clostridia bacterium]
MHFIPFNSRLEYHKTPFGAVVQGTSVHFRVIMPRNINCSALRLIYRSDNNDTVAIPMNWERMEGDHEEWWSVSFSPENIDIYWYFFEYDANSGRGTIKNIGNGVGKMGCEGEEWQLTVYSKDYKTPDWIKGGIMYQIFPDRFCSSGEKKENIPTERQLRNDWSGQPNWNPDKDGRITAYDYFGGDLKGIESKLGYLERLGVNCLYLNPIFEAHSNHRYDTADYMKIDPLLGVQEDFESLCHNAEKKGIKIILDGVFSHTGNDSIYFNALGRYNSVGAYQSQLSSYYNWYKWNSWPNDYASWWGVDILPEINEDEQSFVDYITGKNGVVRKWLRDGASGWRLDVADELPDTFIDRLRSAAKEENSDNYILGEVWEDASNKTSYGVRRRYLLGDQLDSVMNYPFADIIINFLKTGKTDGFMETVMNIIENYPPPAIDTLMNHIGTHDTARAITKLAGTDYNFKDRRKYAKKFLSNEQRLFGIQLMKMASAIQFTLPGVPCVYYGDEAGLEGYGDPFNRGCYPWGSENKELLDWYEKLGEIRKNCFALKHGHFVPISSSMGCICYARICEESGIIIISNRNAHSITYKLPDDWEKSKCVLGAEVNDNGNVPVEACSVAVLCK